jgi:hypothetical protein
MSFALASQTTTKGNAGNASIGYQAQTTATLVFPRLVILVEDLHADVNCFTSILTRYEVTNDCYVEQLENERGEMYYRACRNGVCRYCEDLWMAQMYAKSMSDRG